MSQKDKPKTNWKFLLASWWNSGLFSWLRFTTQHPSESCFFQRESLKSSLSIERKWGIFFNSVRDSLQEAGWIIVAKGGEYQGTNCMTFCLRIRHCRLRSTCAPLRSSLTFMKHMFQSQENQIESVFLMYGLQNMYPTLRAQSGECFGFSIWITVPVNEVRHHHA